MIHTRVVSVKNMYGGWTNWQLLGILPTIRFSEEMAIHTYNYFMSVSQKGYNTKIATDEVELGRV